MARSTREWALRKLDSAKNNCEWSVTHLKAVADRYREAHPDIAKSLDNLCEVVYLVYSMIDEVRDII